MLAPGSRAEYPSMLKDETHYLPPDTDPATVAAVKAALENAMQIEIESEKPGWYLGKFLIIVIPSLIFLLCELAVKKIRR
ncbi:hypothetical protein MCEMSE6_02720 [Oxalobacteraceae bacterium]